MLSASLQHKRSSGYYPLSDRNSRANPLAFQELFGVEYFVVQEELDGLLRDLNLLQQAQFGQPANLKTARLLVRID